MSKRATKPPREHVNILQCALCDDHPEFNVGGGFTAHFAEKHPDLLTDGKLVAQKKGVSFLDGRDFFENTFRIEHDNGTVLGHQLISGPRGKGDPMGDMP